MSHLRRPIGPRILMGACLVASFAMLLGAVRVLTYNPVISCPIPNLRTEVRLAGVEMGMESFHVDVGRYPTAAEGLAALLRNPGIANWRGPYIIAHTVPKDEWGRDFLYNPNGKRGLYYDLYSAGPDGQEGTEDDIGNWGADEEK